MGGGALGTCKACNGEKEVAVSIAERSHGQRRWRGYGRRSARRSPNRRDQLDKVFKKNWRKIGREKVKGPSRYPARRGGYCHPVFCPKWSFLNPVARTRGGRPTPAANSIAGWPPARGRTGRRRRSTPEGTPRRRPATLPGSWPPRRAYGALSPRKGPPRPCEGHGRPCRGTFGNRPPDVEECAPAAPTPPLSSCGGAAGRGAAQGPALAFGHPVRTRVAPACGECGEPSELVVGSR